MPNTTIDKLQFADHSGNDHFKAEPEGWRRYLKIPVDKNGGALITKGSFGHVKVYCETQSVFYGGRREPREIPKGKERPLEDLLYPEAICLGVVLFQLAADGKTASYFPVTVTATDKEHANEFELDAKTKNLYVAYNDKPGMYYDNNGPFDIHVKLIQ